MSNLLFAGDVVITSPQTNFLDNKISELIQSHDLVSCNLEAPVVSGAPAIAKIGPAIEQPKASIDLLKKAGFNFFNLANNHIMDHGSVGLAKTLEQLSDVQHIGAGPDYASTYKLLKRTVDGTTFGFLSLAEWGFGALDTTNDTGFAWINHPKVNDLVKQSAQQVDHLIIQAHCGVEDTSLPLPEWQERYRELIRLGANVIIGHHTHTVQGMEEYANGLIFYSLGNFYFEKYGADSEWYEGALLSLTYAQKKLTNWEIIPTQAKQTITLDTRPERITRFVDRSKITTKKVDEMLLSLWYERYQHFFQRSLGGFSTLRGFVKSIINRMMGTQVDYLLLSHNLNIESHRYVAARISKLLSE